jgi:hypothetical protein
MVEVARKNGISTLSCTYATPAANHQVPGALHRKSAA